MTCSRSPLRSIEDGAQSAVLLYCKRDSQWHVGMWSIKTRFIFDKQSPALVLNR